MPISGPFDSRRARRFVRTAAAVTAAVSVAAACSATGGKPASTPSGGEAGVADTPRFTVAMITHEAPGDSFWDLIRKGAEAAAAKDNIELKYSADDQGPNQANLIQNALDSDVDAIAVTLARPEPMAPAVEKAVAAEIPVVAFNSGSDEWKAMGALSYFGQDDLVAGKAAGERLGKEGAKHVVCVIQVQGAINLENRCAGVKQALPGANVETLNVNGADMPSVEATMTAKLQQDPTIDRIVALGAPIALTAVQSVSNAGSQAQIVTFDTNAALVDAIKSGDVKWAVDQQPYLQGYLAIDSLWLYLNNRNVMGGGVPVLTGPAFIDESNIESIAELAKAGTR
jgi:simple sugar transport system substrate-binding protein